MLTDQSLQQNTRTELNRLLQHRILHPHEREQIDAEIRHRFAETHAVMVLDSSGFSRKTRMQGIIATLCTIYQMNSIALALFPMYDGQVIKLEADNIFAVFPTVRAAVDAGIDLLERLAAIEMQASIGIGYGELLMLAAENQCGRDMYGHELNLAAKLGEDLADVGELLLTAAAYDMLGPHPGQWDQLELSISRISISAYRLCQFTDR